MYAELIHDLLKNTGFAQTLIGASETLTAGIADDHNTAASLVDREISLLASGIIDTD